MSQALDAIVLHHEVEQFLCHEADLLQQIGEVAEVEAGLVEVELVFLPAVDQANPRGVRPSLKVLPVLRVDTDDPIHVRDRDANLSTWEQDFVPTT